MNAFWIAGIAINGVALAAVVFWARKAWKQADEERRNRNGGQAEARSHRP